MTINTVIKQDKYPIPCIEELFASLARGRSFSKLDLSHAYLQVPLDTQSQKYVTIATHKGLFQYIRLGVITTVMLPMSVGKPATGNFGNLGLSR